MRKRSRNQSKTVKFQKRSNKSNMEPQDMDDEIDTFHKMRDMVPLENNIDSSDSDGDFEQPVFGHEDIDEEFHEENDDEDEDGGLAAKIVKQQRYLRAKFGGFDEEIGKDDEEEEAKQPGWGGKKARYHGGDNRDFELKSSDDEALKEEEEEILRLQREKAKLLSLEDFGISEIGDDGIDQDPTLEDLSGKEFADEKKLLELSSVDDPSAYFRIQKDQNSLSREELMDVVKSCAPELVGLLLELKLSLDELDNNLNPFLSKLKEKGVKMDGTLRYIEIKQLLLLSYCQAITFYLLLKSEGQSIRDHPILSRIVEIKELLNKSKKLEGNQRINLVDLLKVYLDDTKTNSGLTNDMELVTACNEYIDVKVLEPEDENIMANDRELKVKREKHKFGAESLEMLKIRASLEAKLKSKGSFTVPSVANKTKKREKRLDGLLDALDDYDDVAISKKDSKLSHVVSSKQRKPSLISGDEDIPKRDDIGERRKRYELKVLSGAGIKSEEDAYEEGPSYDEGLPPSSGNGNEEDSLSSEHDDSEERDLYSEVKRKREERLAAKSEMYKRGATLSSAPDLVDGKRLISHQIEKNRGLTRSRNKLTKNPRKKYRTKHDKAQKRRKGQVRDIKKPVGSYGGETSGINPRISRSVRF